MYGHIWCVRNTTIYIRLYYDSSMIPNLRVQCIFTSSIIYVHQIMTWTYKPFIVYS